LYTDAKCYGDEGQNDKKPKVRRSKLTQVFHGFPPYEFLEVDKITNRVLIRKIDEADPLQCPRPSRR